MKPFSSAAWGMGVTVVYLLDDRVEVGLIGIGYSEELRRVAYREAAAVVFWRSRRTRFLVIGGLFVAAGIGVALSLVSTNAAAAAAIGGIVAAMGALLLFQGRDGTVLEFRVDGPGGSVTGVVTGGRAKQERFTDALVRRIEARRRRVPA